tara:strand:- start:4577 stop:4735 length:159 start_codon:yes stop_codon:yes gene_type:complete
MVGRTLLVAVSQAVHNDWWASLGGIQRAGALLTHGDVMPTYLAGQTGIAITI